MIDDEICKTRNELNKSIEDGVAYSKIYEISVKLDKLIAKYYEENAKNREGMNFNG